MDFREISNLPIFWLLCGFTVLVSVVQTLLYVMQANKATATCGIDPDIPKKAFKIGLVSAIGPACGVFIVMVGLMSSIGGPMAWLRLSIIGAAPTELAAATMGATAAGLKDGLTDPGYNISTLAVSWFAMALNGAGWLLVTGLFTPSLEVLRDKMSGGDTSWLGDMSAACSIGVFSYLVSNQMITGAGEINVGGLAGSIGGGVSMLLMGLFLIPKMPKLAEYSLGIAMLVGIATALVFVG